MVADADMSAMIVAVVNVAKAVRIFVKMVAQVVAGLYAKTIVRVPALIRAGPGAMVNVKTNVHLSRKLRWRMSNRL